MAEQSYGSAGSRNSSSAAGISGKVSVGQPGNGTVSGNKTSTAGNSPVQKGPGNAGFSGTNLIPGKVKA